MCFNTLTLFLPIIIIFFKTRTLQLFLWGNSFGNPVETSIYSPISKHVDWKIYLTLFLPIITIFFKTRTSWLLLWDNSWNLVDTNTYSSIFRHVDQKRYLTSFLPIITIFFQKLNVAITFIRQLFWKSGRKK